MKDYRQLTVWQRSQRFTLLIYSLTKRFPREELFGITGQLRRASTSVAANLAEGCGRASEAEFKRFVDIAHGSASESEYFLLLAHDLGIISARDHERFSDEVSQIKRMLGALSRRLKADS